MKILSLKVSYYNKDNSRSLMNKADNVDLYVSLLHFQSDIIVTLGKSCLSCKHTLSELSFLHCKKTSKSIKLMMIQFQVIGQRLA